MGMQQPQGMPHFVADYSRFKETIDPRVRQATSDTAHASPWGACSNLRKSVDEVSIVGEYIATILGGHLRL
jgi:hypothetical protein